MPKDFTRSDRVADAVQRSLARHIPVEIRDPRIGMVNINSVDVAKDLTLAKIYVTLIGENNADVCQESVTILNKAASFLRTLVAKDLSVRSVPKFFFYYDATSVKGQALSHLIDKAIAADKQAAQKNTPNSEE